MEETLDTKPSHYHSDAFKAHEVEEEVYLNICLGKKDRSPIVSYTVKIETLLKAKWASMGLKHLLRAGLKDNIDCELKKAENYLHKARTGEWMND
jgi:hypothetical protein